MTATVAPVVGYGDWHRLSPRMLLVHPVMEIIRAVPALLGIVVAGSAGGHGAVAGAVSAGIVAALSLTRWFTTRLRITPEHVQLRHGLVRRRTIATRRDRIRTVDVTSHLLHRVLGLARVVIGTGISDRKGEGRIVLDGLTLTTATALRDQLLHRGSAPADPEPAPGGVAVAVDAACAGAPEQMRDIARLDPAWLRYAPFTLSGVITGFVLYGFLWRIQGEAGVNLVRSGPLHSLATWLDRMPTAAAVTTVVVALVVFVAVTSTAGYLLAFWNFRLARHDGGTLQVTRGLLTTRATSIERRRLVGVEISETLLLRWVGGAKTSAVATGLRVGRGSDRGGEVLLPPAPRAAAEGVAAAVLDGSAAACAELRAHGSVARRRRFTRAFAVGCLVLAAAVAGWLAGAPAWLVGPGVAPVLVAGPLALDRFHSLGHGFVDGYLVSRSGSLLRRRTALASAAVIGWNLRSSLLQRIAGVTSLTATTAAGRQGYRVQDVDPAEALLLADAVSPGLLSQFLAAPRREHPATSP